MLTNSVTPLLVVIPSERYDAIRSRSLPIVWSLMFDVVRDYLCGIFCRFVVTGCGVLLELSGLDLCSTAVGIGVFFFRGEHLGKAEELLGCSGATGVCGQSVHYIRRVGVACPGVHSLRAWSPVGV